MNAHGHSTDPYNDVPHNPVGYGRDRTVHPNGFYMNENGRGNPSPTTMFRITL